MRSTMELKQGDLENLILNALWDLEAEGFSQVFVASVQERICGAERKWAYTTVKTVMDRLVEKELAARFKQGKKYYYASLASREVAAHTAVTKVVRQFFKEDWDELLACVAKLREAHFVAARAAKAAVPAAAVAQLERVYQQSAEVKAAQRFDQDVHLLVGG